jgi:serine phosphatase RsbU (regulator of sigma subunit)
MKKFFLPGCIIFLLLFVHRALGEIISDTISIRNFKAGLSLGDPWKYKTGDVRKAAAINYDDSDWLLSSSSVDETDSAAGSYQGIFWCRKSFFVDSTVGDIPFTLRFRVNSACDIFIDGKPVRSLGVVAPSAKEQVSGFSILPVLIPLSLSGPGKHLIAVRTTTFGPNLNMAFLHVNTRHSIVNFQAEILSSQEALKDKDDIRIFTIPVFFSGIFIVLSIFHFILFLYYRKNRSNLYYSLLTFLLFLLFFSFYTTMSGADLETVKNMLMVDGVSLFLAPLFFLGILYEVFYKRLLVMFWILAGLFTLLLISLFVLENDTWAGPLVLAYLLGGAIETIRVYIRAWIRKKEGSRIFLLGLFFPLLGLITLSLAGWILETAGLQELADKISDHTGEFFIYALLMSVSFSMTIYLARDFAKMNRKLQEQIREIKHLFDRTIEQENERKRILENQNVELERMVTFRTEEVVRQKAEIEQKNHDILDNLHYARRIQEAILPEIKLIYEYLKDSFILYWPKDIVSGDFYSFSQRDDKVIISAADCTGHGVTGAFMSMIGSSLLNQIVNEQGITRPAGILNKLNEGIIQALKQNETEINDGMDIALCSLDLNRMKLEFAGANRPLWFFRNGTFNEIKADKLAIGGFRVHRNASFNNHELNLVKGDTLYIFTDGFVDQFGEVNGKKLLSKNFRELLNSIQELAMRDQEKKLTEFFLQWKGRATQIDDVLVIGIRV